MTSTDAASLDDAVINWVRRAKPTVTADDIRSSDLVEARILDSMQFLDFVYFLNELCGADITSYITIDDMRSLPRIVAFIKTKRTS